MQSGSLSAFAKAREEIQLWPAATAAFYFTVNDSPWVLILFMMLTVAGAITYKMHEALREALTNRNRFSDVRNRNSRNKIKNETNPFVVGFEVWDATRPDNKVIRTLAVAGMATNLVAGGCLFIWLFLRLIGPVSPSITGVGLLSLPLLIAAMMASSIVWSS
ncbi:hypothetical protein SAMN04487949_2764 [Halogranum gelatinilyticum]|uniref:Uncharacterized protein n=1 Tax=Halogranum gelatinilyticum TaxID=660521 RepID=A0A1G9WHJ2_9EURY|nr:hypothetical protein [Halogranum gelatinilyticum]SDM84008.1 hypothetical protein SAMN04487949_2764 [Halogranum gelatinilyticum]